MAAARGRQAQGGPRDGGRKYSGARDGGRERSGGRDGGHEYSGPHHLYVHVPFCRARCDYCDFYSVPVGEPAARSAVRSPGCADPDASAADRSEALLDRYLAAVLAEWGLERAAPGVGRLRTVYVGGGTPSLLGARRLERLLGAFDGHLTPRAEVTVETNPEDVSADYARWAAGRGLRISLGVQSFVPRLRAALGRRALADPAAAYLRLRAAGCRDVGIDLIFGVPGQTAADLQVDLAAVAELRPDHVSWYELDVAVATPLGVRLDAAATNAAADTRPDDDGRAAMYRAIVRGLGGLGYGWYEISNFATAGRRCRHNSAVWRGEDYLGLGPGAVSTLGDRRRSNTPDLAAYLVALTREDGGASGALAAPPRELELLGPLERARERLYLGARTGAAVPLGEIKEVLDSRAILPLERAGFVRVAGGTLRVTRKGRFVADDLCVRLFRASCVQGTTAVSREADHAIAPREMA